MNHPAKTSRTPAPEATIPATNATRRQWQVTAIEWLSHRAVIAAETAGQAEAEAARLWAENGEHAYFRFTDSGLDGFAIEEIAAEP